MYNNLIIINIIILYMLKFIIKDYFYYSKLNLKNVNLVNKLNNNIIENL